MKKAEYISVVTDPVTGDSRVVLEFPACGLVVPLPVTHAEAHYLDLVLQGIRTPRPMPYDLAGALLGATGGALQSTRITLDSADALSGAMDITRTGCETRIFCSVADAVAMAVRWGVPCYMDMQIFSVTRYIDRHCVCHADQQALELLTRQGEASFVLYRDR